MCSPGWSGTYYGDQADLELTEIHHLCVPSAGIGSVATTCPCDISLAFSPQMPIALEPPHQSQIELQGQKVYTGQSRPL